MSRRKCDCSLNGVGKQCRHLRSFEKLVTALAPSLSSLKVIAVSVPDLGESMIPTLTEMHSVLLPSLQSLNLWQLDGRPMSGDVGAGATRASVALASRLVTSPDCPPGMLDVPQRTANQFFSLRHCT
jgi:hypothetical protein